ncbi:MAG: glycosyl hydrolase family 25 [Alphaproteobacteria bacterium]|nr:glycosyl hydrolase family 25 [Alphaproteobacteria bacterium]
MILSVLLACVEVPFIPAEPPDGFAHHGIDVSAWQRRVDWEAVAGSGEVQFAWIKATEGGRHVDRRFATNWADARDAGVPVGAYHYYSACRTGREQAEHFISRVPREEDALPPALDVEVDARCNGSERLKVALPEIEEWLTLVGDHYGVEPVVYGTDHFQTDALGDLGHRRWVAAWSRPPRRTRGWTVWQHTDRGSVPGIAGPVDRNVLSGEGAALLRR